MTACQRVFAAIFGICAVCVRFSEQGCSPPEDVVGGYYEPRKEDYPYGDKINYQCDIGHYLANGRRTRTCQGIVHISAFTWTGDNPRCSRVDCGQPTIPNASYDFPLHTTYDSTMSYRCRDGLAPMGNLLAKCTGNASWIYTECQEPEFQCPPAPAVANANHNASQARQQHGTTVKYQCDIGYNIDRKNSSIFCHRTTWRGTVPACIAIDEPDQRTRGQPDLLSENALPIVAGVVTAVLLTAILVITVLCLRKRYRKPPHSNPESISSASPDVPSPPRPLHIMTSNGSIMRVVPPDSTLPLPPAAAAVHTLPYHKLQCAHNHSTIDYMRGDQNYVPDSSLTHFRPLVGNSDYQHSASPSTVQSDVSVTDSEFHTIRECLGDFKNNNLPNSYTPQLQHFQTAPHRERHTHQTNQPAFNHRTITPHIRTLWTQDGRPYEAVTCSHGVEHVYQPLEHIYEEPHIWTRPLPKP